MTARSADTVLVVEALRALHDTIADLRDSVVEQGMDYPDWRNFFKAGGLIMRLEELHIDGTGAAL